MIVPLPPTSAVAFVDAQHGWIGDSAGLFSTTDGRRFRLAAHTPVIGIDALDRTHAWALSGYGLILRTTDGRSWRTLTSPHLFTVKFVDRRNGFGLTRDGTDQLKLRIVEDCLCDGAAGPAGCARHADADHATKSGIMPTPSGLWMEWVIEV